MIICCGWSACARVELNCLSLHLCGCVLSAERDVCLLRLPWALAIACLCGFVPKVWWVTLCLFWQNTGWKFCQGWHSSHETLEFNSDELRTPIIHVHLYFSTVLWVHHRTPISCYSLADAFCSFVLPHRDTVSVLWFDFISFILLCASAHCSVCCFVFIKPILGNQWHGTVLVSTLACSSHFPPTLLSCTFVCVYAITK